MKKHGFTLIELMIVVALMGILAEVFFAPGRALLGIDKRTGQILDDNRNMVAEFMRLREFNRQSPAITKVNDFSISYSDGAEVSFDADRNFIMLRRGSQTSELRSLQFIKPAIKLNDRTWSIKMQVNGELLNTIWRCGNEE